MDALVWGFNGQRTIETFIVVVDTTAVIATRGPIVSKWRGVYCRTSDAVEDAHDQAIRDTISAESEGQEMTLPPTRVPLTAEEVVILTDPHAPPLKDAFINDLLRRGMGEHLKRGVPRRQATLYRLSRMDR